MDEVARIAELEAEIKRLRKQNKASSDEWMRRTAKLQSDYDRMLNLHRWALESGTKTYNEGRCPLCYKPHSHSAIVSTSEFASALLTLRDSAE